MATAYTQSKQNDKTVSGTVSSWTVTFDTNVTAGNLIWCRVYHNDTVNEITTPTDSLGNTYVLIDSVTDAGNSACLKTYYAKNVAGGSCTITEAFAGPVNFPGLVAHEISGADTATPLNKHIVSAALSGASVGTGTDALTSGSQTTTVDGCLILGDVVQVAGSPIAPTHGTAYTTRASDTAFGSFTEDKVQSTAGAVAGTWTLPSASGTFYAAMSAFAPPASGSPTNSVLPAVTGTTQVGSVLTVSNGTWTGSPTFTRKWQRDNFGQGSYSDIVGQTAATYTLTDADDACQIRSIVTATNGSGNASATSAAVGPVTEPAPVCTVSPAVTYTSLAYGNALTGTTGTWSNMGGFNAFYTFQWQRTLHGGSSWANVPGATSVNYTDVAADVGYDFRLNVTAHNQ